MKTFSEAVYERLKGKFVEVYGYTSSTTQYYSDLAANRKELIRGILIDCDGDLLVIEVTTENNSKNLVYLNGWGVQILIEPKNGISMVDVCVDEHEKVNK